MKVKEKLKKYKKIYKIILETLYFLNIYKKRFWKKYKNFQPDEWWQKRINLVVKSPDNNKINKVENAGKIFSDYQLMHNGLKIHLGSYYNLGNSKLLEANSGIHEPQEEYCFQEVLKHLNHNASMLELGSYWSFYSMWFQQSIKNPVNIMVEPDPYKLFWGEKNFKLNNFRGTFVNAFISNQLNLKSNPPVMTVDYILFKYKIDFLDILHSDIQGYELNMLKGSINALKNYKIKYLFISSHSNDIHDECVKLLNSYQYVIVASANLNETYSWDGLIVACSPQIDNFKSLNIEKLKQSL